MLRPAAVLLTVAALLLTAAGAPASASAAPPRSAEAYVRAFERAKAVTARQVVGLEARIERRMAPCAALAGKIEADHPAFDVVLDIVLRVSVEEGVLNPVTPVLAQLTRDLDAIRTDDQVLRRARSIWRARYDGFLRLPRVPDACERLVAWQATGWAPAAEPAHPPNPFKVILEEDDGGAADREVARAVTRLRALGMGPRRAQRADGEDMMQPLLDALDVDAR